MTPRSITLGLIEGAIDRVERTIEHIFLREAPLHWAAQTDLMSMDPLQEERTRANEQAEFRARPTLSAVNFCLTSATALLGICHSLVDHEGPQSPYERERLWKQLAADTKVAGRAAYRAALVLADPTEAGDQAHALSMPGQDDSEEFRLREEVLRQSDLHRHWVRIKARGVSAAEFTEFLRPLIASEDVCIAYVYRDDEGLEKIYNHVEGVDVFNPMLEAIRGGQLSLQAALGFALNDQGRQWIRSSFVSTA